MPMYVSFVTGPMQSGKSAYALNLARRYNGRRVFIATAEPLDEEMSKRIQAHRDERGADFTTVEAPVDLARAVQENLDAQVIVIDCLTLWVSNWLTQRPKDDFAVGEKAFLDVLMDQVASPPGII